MSTMEIEAGLLARVFRKREFSNYTPETIGNFGPGRRKPERGDGWLVRKSLPWLAFHSKKPPKTERFQGLAILVAGIGFEPMTFRL